MAERRMFSKMITDSDAFLDMPLSTQALYFHLSMKADDDGFVNNPKRIQRLIGATDDDYRLLIAKSFILAFESGVIVIKHWRINNWIRSDRKTPTTYIDEMDMLRIKENGAYTLETLENRGVQPLDNQVPTTCQPDANLINYPNYTDIEPISIQESKSNKQRISNNTDDIEDILNNSSLSDPVKDSVKEWVAYKKEQHRFTYKPIGFKKLLTEISNQEQAIGSVKVINAMNLSMAKGYQGIIWDLVKDSKGNSYMDAVKNRVSEVDDWI